MAYVIAQSAPAPELQAPILGALAAVLGLVGVVGVAWVALVMRRPMWTPTQVG